MKDSKSQEDPWVELSKTISPSEEWATFYSMVKKNRYWDRKDDFFAWISKVKSEPKPEPEPAPEPEPKPEPEPEEDGWEEQDLEGPWVELAKTTDPGAEWNIFYGVAKQNGYWGRREDFFAWVDENGDFEAFAKVKPALDEKFRSEKQKTSSVIRTNAEEITGKKKEKKREKEAKHLRVDKWNEFGVNLNNYSAKISSNPLVSVVIPTFNRSKIVCDAITSVLQQTHKNIEIIVVDDGGKDTTKKNIKKEFGDLVKKKKIRYIYKENGGIASALNRGIKEAKGELIAWLSDDDWYDDKYNTLLEDSVRVHKQDPEVGLTYTNYRICWADGRKTIYDAFFSNNQRNGDEFNRIQNFVALLDICYINGSSTVIKKDVFYTVGNYNEKLLYGQDYDMWFKICLNYKIHKIPKTLLNYRMSEYQRDPKQTSDGCRIESEILRERYKLMAMGKRPTVCAEICMKNEKDMIDQCLNDLSGYVDKIVIFDDGSTDGSEKMIKKWKKVTDIYRQEPKGNVRTEGEDRQKLLEMAQSSKCDWILFIDSDEVFEDFYKTEIFYEMLNNNMNLYYYLELNFWKSTTHYRIDELWLKGWFARLFRNLPGLKMNDGINEHCGGVPTNIPNAPIWYDKNLSTKGRKSKIRVKHYGYSDWDRVKKRYKLLMERDKDVDLKGRHRRYDRMLYEKGIVLNEYPGDYYVSWALKKVEDKSHLVGSPAVYEKEEPKFEIKVNGKVKVLIMNFTYDPAGAGYMLYNSLKDSKKIEPEYINFLNTNQAPRVVPGNIKAIVDNADIIHYNQYLPFSVRNFPDEHEHNNLMEKTRYCGVDWEDMLQKKPYLLHNHGGAVLLDANRYTYGLKTQPMVVCSPISLTLFDNCIWIPNVMPIYDDVYTPDKARNWEGDINVIQKIFHQNAGKYKGTDILEEMINIFVKKKFGYHINFKVISGLERTECLKLARPNLACVDNITQGFVGLAGWEAMSQGQVVLARLDPIVSQSYTDLGEGVHPPIINVSGMDELCNKLIELNNNRKNMKDIAMSGRRWIEEYYTPNKIRMLWEKLYFDLLR